MARIIVAKMPIQADRSGPIESVVALFMEKKELRFLFKTSFSAQFSACVCVCVECVCVCVCMRGLKFDALFLFVAGSKTEY